MKKLKEINDAPQTKSKESPSTGSYGSLCSAASVGGIQSSKATFGVFQDRLKSA